MRADVGVQLRRYRPPFVGVALTLLLFGIPPLVWTGVEPVEIVGVLAMLLAWCFAVGFSGYEVFRHLHHSDDYLLLSSPLGPRDAVIPRVIALAIWLTTLYTVSLLLWRIHQCQVDVPVSVVELGYYALTRLASFFAFFTVTMVLSAAAKTIRQRSLALLAVATLILTATVAVAVLALTVTRMTHPDHVWTLGVDTTYAGFNQYIMAMPIVFRPVELSRVSETILPGTLALNVVIGAGAVALWRWPLRRMRMNFV